MNCKKCGAENPEESQFCSNCGNNFKFKKKIINNYFLVLALLCFIVSFFVTDIIIITLFASFILSIIGIVKSAKVKKEIGKRKGLTISIIILVLSSMIIIVSLVLSLMGTTLIDLEFVGDSVETTAMQKVDKEIKNQLKNPESLQIHNITKNYSYINENGKIQFVSTQDNLKIALEKSPKQEYTIYYKIDYSAQNGFGGMNRSTISATIIIYNRGEKITYSTPQIKFNE